MSSDTVDRARSHAPRLVQTAQVQHLVHGESGIGRFNSHVAVLITKGVGTMWIAYLFVSLALISLPAALASRDVIVIVGWIAQTFLQLVLLPIIIVGQNIIQAANDARAEADHKTLTAIHTLTVDVHRINETQTTILERLDRTAPR